MKRSILLAVTVLALAASGYAQLKFTSLDFPGSNLTTARGINDHGDIVGAYRTFGPRHAMLIKKGVFIPLAPTTILGTYYSEATNINNRGDITGQMIDDNGFAHGFFWRDGVLTTLDFPGADDTFALGVNDSGLVVGYWDSVDVYGDLLANHGFTWKDGVFTQFDYPGGPVTGIFGINARSDIVGVWLTDVNSPFEHGFACPKEAPCFSFDVPVPGSTLTQADEINAHGQIVGVYIDVDDVWHGFLMAGASFTSLDFPGSTGTGAYGINSAGQIVGKYFASDGSTHGFLAQPVRKQKPQ